MKSRQRDASSFPYILQKRPKIRKAYYKFLFDMARVANPLLSQIGFASREVTGRKLQRVGKGFLPRIDFELREVAWVEYHRALAIQLI